MSSTPKDYPDIERVKEQDVRDLTKAECLLEIHRILGYNRRGATQLGKPVLNSAVWHLTGTQPVKPERFHTDETVPYRPLRRQVATAAGFVYEPPTDEAIGKSSPFRRNQLRALLRALRATSDKRV
jgi:hypothetical protein